MNTEAKRAWRFIAARLGRLGILSEVDAYALERYCRMWAEWREMQTFIDKNGCVYSQKNRRGDVVCVRMLPQVRIRNHLASELSQIESLFGMSPAARASIRTAVNETDSADPLAELMRG